MTKSDADDLVAGGSCDLSDWLLHGLLVYCSMHVLLEISKGRLRQCMPKRGRGKASRGRGRGGVSRGVLPGSSFVRGARGGSEDTEDLNLRLGFLRAETGYQPMSLHGLSAEGDKEQSEVAALHAELRELGGEVPTTKRWVNNITHLQNRIDQLKQQKAVGGGGSGAGGGGGSGVLVVGAGAAKDSKKLQKLLDEGTLDYEDRASVTEELRLLMHIADTASDRRRAGQTVHQLGEKMKTAQNTFNQKKPSYNREKNAPGFRGELLKALRSATHPFLTNAAFAEEFKIVTGLMIDYRKTFEAQITTQKQFQLAQQQHEKEADEIEDMRVEARKLERKRKEREVERQMFKKPRRGIGVEDGSSQKTSSSVGSSASSASFPPDPPPECDEINSLALGDMDDDEDEGGAAAAAASAVLPSEDEY